MPSRPKQKNRLFRVNTMSTLSPALDLHPRKPVKRLVIPHRVHLPFGYIVAIRQITDTEMDEMIEADDAGEPADGYWNPDTRIIYLRKRLPMRRRRYILAHEMAHAVNDWLHHYLDCGIASHA